MMNCCTARGVRGGIKAKRLGRLAVVAAAAGAATSAWGQTTWTNGKGDALWNEDLNWSASQPNAATAAILPASIPANGNPITLQTGSQADSLTINAAYTLSGGDLALTSGNVTVAGGVTATINTTLLGTTNGLNLLGPGTLVLGAPNSYTGTTSILNGTLRLGVDNALPTTQGLVLGGGTAVGGVDSRAGNFNMGTFNQTVSTLQSLSTSASQTNTVTIGTGKQLTVTGNATFGPLLVGSSNRTTFTGGGTLAFTGTGSTVLIGGSNSLTQNVTPINTTTLDLRGLGAVTANVTNFSVGLGSETTGTLFLSNGNNDITATTVTVGNSAGNNGPNSTMTLGSGTNAFHATTINIGISKVAGTVAFTSTNAGSAGTITITGKAGGTTTANMTIGSKGTTSTGASQASTFDVRGHVATIQAGTVVVAQDQSTGSTGVFGGTVSFDTGTFMVNSLTLGNKTSTGTSGVSAVLNVGGGSFTVKQAFLLANNGGANGAATAVVNLTGGTMTVNANITAGGQVNSFNTFNVNGGTLDLTEHFIGSATAAVNLKLTSGVLANVAEFNGGATLSKTAAGTVVFTGNNGYTGGTTISAGKIQVTSATGLGGSGSTATVSVGDNGALQLDAPAIPVGAGLAITSADAAPEVALTYAGTDVIAALTLNGNVLTDGVYGSSASGATNNANIVALGLNPDDFFSGVGTVTVATPEPTSLGLVALASAGLLRRRKRRAPRIAE